MTDLPDIFLKPGGDRRLKGGHPWVYSNEIRMDDAAKALPPGGLARLHRVDGKPLGVGTFNPHALICFRRFGGPRTAVGPALLAERLGQALTLRERLFDAPYYRLVHAEADGLPGLVVDRFGDVAVLQTGTMGMEGLLPDVLAALDALLAPRAMVVRNDGAARSFENMERYVRVEKGELDGPVEIRDGDLVFFGDPLEGQKTGWFFDQRDNRRFVAGLARGTRMIDVYSYGGGFGLHAAAAGAASVRIIDSSEAALALAKRAAEHNGLTDRVTLTKAEAFAELDRLGEDGERFGVVNCDPPAFVKSKKDLKAGLKGYRKLAALAARLVEPQGFLSVASCSHNVSTDQLTAEIAAGIGRAGRTGRIIRTAGAAPDHPVHPQLPETAYLKSVVIALD